MYVCAYVCVQHTCSTHENQKSHERFSLTPGLQVAEKRLDLLSPRGGLPNAVHRRSTTFSLMALYRLSHTPQPNSPTAAHLQLTAVTLQLFCLLPPPFQILTEHRALALDHGREAVGEAYRGSRGLSSSGLGMHYGELSTGERGHTGVRGWGAAQGFSSLTPAGSECAD